MHWIDEAVDKMISANPDKNDYVCAAGISPSGSIHLGNFREFITAYFIAEGLKRRGKNVRFYLSFDNYDRLRKIPATVRAVVGDTFDKYVGMPYSEVPDPFGCHESYAVHHEEEFKNAIKQIGIDAEYIYQSDKYKNGDYTDNIVLAMQNREKIYDILYEYKRQEATEEGRASYVPLSIYCSKCQHDSTHVYHISDDNMQLAYRCECGNDETIDVRTYHHTKLVWKVDWPMRWQYENVDFEPGGKDHGTQGSSYTTGAIISREIYGKTAPDFVMYEFVGIKGGDGKMSSSTSTTVFTPAEVLKVCPPEMLLWLFSRVDCRQSWNFCLDEEILRQYHEFDRMCEAYYKPECPENIKNIMYYALNNTGKKPSTVSAQLLASLAPIVNFDFDMLKGLYAKLNLNVSDEDLADRLAKIKYWMQTYSPESITTLNTTADAEYYGALSDDEKANIDRLYEELSAGDYSLDALQQLLYAIPMREGCDKKQNLELQKKFFENVYMLLTGKKSGPRLYLFLGALDKKQYLDLLKF